MTAHKFIPPRVIVITGASSGIGQALAEHYAQAGIVLALTGRNQERLQAVAASCEKKGAIVIQSLIDVTDRAGMAQWLVALDQEHPIDMVIANAGVSAGTGGVLIGEDPAQVRYIFDVNVHGVLNTIAPVQEKMATRGHGRIVIMSSLAGYRGWPGAPAYCASKAAVKIYGEALRGALKKTGIGVHVVCPGFVKSRMTDINEFSMPFIVDSTRAAKIIARGIAKGKGRIAFPYAPAFIAWFLMALPDFLAQIFLFSTPLKAMNK